MNILIVEDELPAAQKLERLLKRHDPSFEIIGHTQSIKMTVDWLKNAATLPDLIFMDIQLSDGLSFDIFKQIPIEKPVIFTTAFDQYAIEAFKTNSIDYLLKPITFDSLSKSMEKMETLKKNLQDDDKEEYGQLEALLGKLQQKKYKSRFLVKIGEHIKSIQADEIALFYAEGRTVYLVTNEERKFIVDFTLETLEEMLDPGHFFRLSRSFIVQIDAIKDAIVYSSSRLKLILNQKIDKEIVVSRDKVNDFKRWFGGVS